MELTRFSRSRRGIFILPAAARGRGAQVGRWLRGKQSLGLSCVVLVTHVPLGFGRELTHFGEAQLVSSVDRQAGGVGSQKLVLFVDNLGLPGFRGHRG